MRLIDAENLKETYKSWILEYIQKGNNSSKVEATRKCITMIDYINSYNEEDARPSAEWVVTDEERDCACCSRCGWYIDRPNASFAISRYKYCPNCGAWMGGIVR
jgi:hypothetical protein